jgi:hypothetical protein
MQPDYFNLNKASAYIKTTSYIENKDRIKFSKNELEILYAKFLKYTQCILDHTNGQINDLLLKASNERVAIHAELYRIDQLNQVSQVNQASLKDPALQQACNHRGFIEINFSSFVTTAKKREEYHHLLREKGQTFPDRKIYLLRPSSDNRLALDTINNPKFLESELRKIFSTILFFQNGVWAQGEMSKERYSSIDEAIQAFFGGDPNFISANELARGF